MRFYTTQKNEIKDGVFFKIKRMISGSRSLNELITTANYISLYDGPPNDIERLKQLLDRRADDLQIEYMAIK